jgi:hypothetical protein
MRAHHFDILKPRQHQRLEQLAADAAGADGQDLGSPDLRRAGRAGGSNQRP